MSVIKLNEIIMNTDKEDVERIILSPEDIRNFQNLLAINSQVRKIFEAEEEASSFFKAYPDIAELTPKEKREDIFYAVKLEQYYKGVPNKLIYILKKLIKALDGRVLPNHIIELGEHLLTPYAKKNYVSEFGRFTFKDILENVCNQTITLLSDSNYLVKISGEVYEVYIPDMQRVALLPSDIASRLTYEDCLNLHYEPDKGVCLNGSPLRTWGNRLGILHNDFDLVEVL